MMRENAFFLESVFDFFEYRLYLAGTLGAAYYKVIGEAAYLAGIQENYIRCLLVAGNSYSFMSYFK